MTEAGTSHEAGRRAAGNTAVRAAGEALGKVATFVLMSVLARATGEEGLGTYLLALAVAQVAMLLVDLGLDRRLLRDVAGDRSLADRLLFDVLALKVALAVPVFGVVLLVLPLVDDDRALHATTAAVAGGALLEGLARTLQHLFLALERGREVAWVVIVQRVGAALVGVVAVLAGGGPVAAGLAYTLGGALAILLSFVLLRRRVGLPALAVHPRRWPGLGRRSLAFALDDALGLLLYRLDALLLGVLAGTAAVGVYGAAYRLFEANLFVTYALVGAVAPMFTYLRTEGEPTVQAVYATAIRVALALLVPVGVLFVVFADPLVTTVFGDDLASASTALTLLGPAVPLLAVVVISNNLIGSRQEPRRVAQVNGGLLLLNVALNVALIPSRGATGAAIAMLATTAVGALLSAAVASRAIGAVSWVSVLTGPLAAGAVALLVAEVLAGPWVLDAALTLAVYALVLLAVEAVLAPQDLRWLRGLLGRERGAP